VKIEAPLSSRARLRDIAQTAGVSSATVDRVMNGRDGVHQRTREAVIAAARAMGYLPRDPAAAPPLRLTVLLPAGNNPFIDILGDHLERQAAARGDVALGVEMLQAFDPRSIADRLAAVAGQTDGVALLALDHPVVREAIRALTATGVPVATLVSDIQGIPHAGFVGVDNRQAGRLAGLLMGRFLGRGPAKVALFAGSFAYRGHEDREMGFRHILRDEFPALTVVAMHETGEDADRALSEARLLVRQHPDIAGIYNVGGGLPGIAAALTEAGLDQRTVLIAHEATPANKRLLLDGVLDAVIDQNPRVEAREALNLLTAAARGQAYDLIPPRLAVIFRENLPDD
jgi:LacI family transcriptional regulator